MTMMTTMITTRTKQWPCISISPPTGIISPGLIFSPSYWIPDELQRGLNNAVQIQCKHKYKYKYKYKYKHKYKYNRNKNCLIGSLIKLREAWRVQFTSPRQCTTVYIYKLLFPTAPFTFQHFNTFQHFSAQWRKAQIKALPGWAPAFPRLSGTNMPTLITLGLAQICPTILAQMCTPFWHRYSHRFWHKFADQFWH